MKKNIKIKFNLSDWLETISILPTKEIDPKFFHNEKYQKKQEIENEERKQLKEFISELKVKKEENKEIIKEAYVNNKQFPFPELIEMPNFKLLEPLIIRIFERVENKDMYCLLLKNNNVPCYYELIDRMSSDYKSKGAFIPLVIQKNEDSYFNIFRHAIAICPPSEIQSAFEYLAEEYEKILKIDSKSEAKEKESQFRYDFHKSLRQVDPLGNPHGEMIIWSLLQVTDVPHRAVKYVIEYVKELELNTHNK